MRKSRNICIDIGNKKARAANLSQQKEQDKNEWGCFFMQRVYIGLHAAKIYQTIQSVKGFLY